MKKTYSQEFVEQALVKLYSRGDRTVKSVAEELNVNYPTLKNWMKRTAVKQVVACRRKRNVRRTGVRQSN